MEHESRPDPDALLAQVREEDAAAHEGKLSIFLGMCPGVGKTYAMLQAAQQLKREGKQVMVAVVETHGRKETAALLQGLDVLPRRETEHRGHQVTEMDLDGVLSRRPDVVLVDELAHTNAPGSRHPKRWQDVLEILDAGISVISTLNVQHIESRVDIVRQITGVTVSETVPDSILDRADEIELVDLPPAQLLKRLSEGKVYLGERAQTAAENFFKEDHLTALREMALRFTAETVDRDLGDMMRRRRIHGPWKSAERLMVAIAPSPYAESLIRWTRRQAASLDCPWIGVYVETTHTLSDADQVRLGRSMGLVSRLGGEIVAVTDDHVAESLLKVARERNVTQIVLGKTEASRLPSWLTGPTLTDEIMRGSGDIDVCLVRPTQVHTPASAGSLPPVARKHPLHEYAWALGGVVAHTLLGLLMYDAIGYTAVGMLYLMGLIGGAVLLSRGPVLLLAGASALVWNYLFIPPRFTFAIKEPHDIMLFAAFFIVALSMGHLTSRLRQRERAERERQQHTAAILGVTQSAALHAEYAKGLAAALRIIDSVAGATTALVPRADDHTLAETAHPASSFFPQGKEWGVVAWCFNRRQPAGRGTDTLPESEGLYLPLQTATSIMGVLGFRFPEKRVIEPGTLRILEAFALQLALVLEKEHFIEAVKEAEVRDESDRLRRTLLDSVSHELKTPIAVMQAALEGMDHAGSEPAAAPYRVELRIAVQRLHRIVDSLLHMTRLESDVVKPLLDWASVQDVVRKARDMVGEALLEHPLNVDVPDELPLVKVDATLMAQILANLLHNACIHTAKGTRIEVHAGLEADARLVVKVRDHGAGLPPGMEQEVFGKFVRGAGAVAGGTGLGLSIARGFARAQGGELTARTPPDGGAEFTLTVPVEILHATAQSDS